MRKPSGSALATTSASRPMDPRDANVLQARLSGEGLKKRPNLATACREDLWVAGDRLRTVVCSIMRRRRELISVIGVSRPGLG